MAGHNKWSKIKRQKGANDAKRGAVFTKLGSLIAIAARGGTDPATNSALAMVVEKAKAANMPNANIQRSIDRAKDKNATQLEEVTYEGYGPGGVGLIIEAATDNKNRTFPEVRNALTKNGGRIAEPGSVAFQFDRRGVIAVGASGEEALLQVLDAGAEDAVEDEGEITVYTAAKDLAKVRENISASGLDVKDAGLEYVPKNTVALDDEKSEKILRLLDLIEDLDDVINVSSNAEL
ncbi:MAG: YebC/PmpR family DNA-binding transcriptional regulator [Patescibacteria group bacterium]